MPKRETHTLPRLYRWTSQTVHPERRGQLCHEIHHHNGNHLVEFPDHQLILTSRQNLEQVDTEQW